MYWIFRTIKYTEKWPQNTMMIHVKSVKVIDLVQIPIVKISYYDTYYFNYYS